MTVVGAAALHVGVGCTVNVAVCLRLALRSIVGTVSMHPTVFRLWPCIQQYLGCGRASNSI
jgi:hypothetical protein